LCPYRRTHHSRRGCRKTECARARDEDG
jgi:hypothetical protein